MPILPMALASPLTEAAASGNPFLLLRYGNDLGNTFVVVNVMHKQIPLCFPSSHQVISIKSLV